MILFSLWLASSLEKLVENLQYVNPLTKHDNFNSMKMEFGDDINLVCQKGFYPYEWMDNTDKLNQEGLPNREFLLSVIPKVNIRIRLYTC